MSSSSWGRGWARAAAIIAAVAAFYLATWHSLDEFVRATDYHEGIFSDFWEYCYPMARELLARHRPVDGFVYSPLIALLLVPLGALPLAPAMWAWGGLQLAGVAALAWQPFSFFRGRAGGAAFALAGLFLTLTSYPVMHNVRWGQTSTFLVAAVLGAYLLRLRGRLLAPALLLALAVALKFFPFVFLIPFLIRKELRFLAAVAMWGVLLLAVIPALFLGAGDTVQFYRDVFLNVRRIGFTCQWQGGSTLYLPHVMGRVWSGTDFAPPAFQAAFALLGYLLFLANLALLALARRLEDPLWLLWGFCLISMSQPLFLATSWACYFSYLPFCQLFLAWELARAGGRGWRSGAAAVLVSLSFLLSSVFVFAAFPDYRPFGRMGVLLWADLLLMAAFWLRLVPRIAAERRDRPAPPAG